MNAYTRISNALNGLYSTPTIYSHVLTIVSTDLYLNLIHRIQIVYERLEIYVRLHGTRFSTLVGRETFEEMRCQKICDVYL